MSDRILLWGVRGHIPTTQVENTAIGLYVADEDMGSNAASGQKDITVADGTAFADEDTVVISDSASTEIGVIDSIAGNVLTLKQNLINSYTTANSGKVECSQFRWIQNTLSGTTLSWLSGMIRKISPTNEKGDFKRGGGLVTSSPVNIEIVNTSNFYNTITANDIPINGLKFDLIEFSKNVSTSVITETRRFRGISNADNWSIKKYVIPIEPMIHKRVANITTEIDANYEDAPDESTNQIIPVTFGLFDNSYAKMIRTKNKNINAFNTTEGYVMDGGVTITTYPRDLTMFPISNTDSTDPLLTYNIQLSNNTTVLWYVDGVAQSSGTLDLTTHFADKYMKVVEDDNEEGKYRQIESASVDLDTTYQNEIVIVIKKYFTNNLVSDPDEDGSIGNGSWVTIEDIEYEYQADVWPLKSFLDSDGSEITNGIELYAYASDKRVNVNLDDSGDVTLPVYEDVMQYFLLPQFAYEILSGDTDYNMVTIQPTLFETNPDTMVSFFIKPVIDFEKYSGDGNDFYNEWGMSGYTKKVDGLFYRTGEHSNYTLTETGNYDYVTDKKNNTEYYSLISNVTGATASRSAWTFKLPVFPESFSFDSAYLGLYVESMQQWLGEVNSKASVKSRRWIGDSTFVLDTTIGDDWQMRRYTDNGNLKAILDSYFTNATDTNDKNFYFLSQKETTVAPAFIETKYFDITGYTRFELSGVKDKDKYNSVHEILVSFYTKPTLSGLYRYDVAWKQAVVIFKKNVSIKNEIWTFIKGRKFNDSDFWSTRSDVGGGTDDLIQTLPQQYEHICRLQNWSEEGETEKDAGLEYSDKALINTSSDIGGFDNANIDLIRDLRPTFQIQDFAKGWTNVVKKNMCRLGWLAGYVDESGKECIAYLPKVGETGITDTISLSAIPEGKEPGDVQEPKPGDVFAEPFVQYKYNYAEKKFDKRISIKKINRTNWQSAYTPGFGDAKGEELWDYCKDNIWSKYGYQVEPPPADMTDQYYITTYEDAVWFMDKWVRWMLSRRITVPVAFTYQGGSGTYAYEWHVGRHIYLNLPHQTNGVALESVIEGIQKDIDGNFCTLSLVILETTETPDYLYKDVTGSADEDWVDTTTEYANDNDKVDTTG